jgi:hypothetical protein
VSDLKCFSTFPGNVLEIVAHEYFRPLMDRRDVRRPCEDDLIVICDVLKFIRMSIPKCYVRE